MLPTDAAIIPHREPLRTTLARTVTIAVVVGAAISPRLGGMRQWPLASLLVFWPSFGGHWVELAYLNVARPRLRAARVAQFAARLAFWFAGGCLFAIGMRLTANAFGRTQFSRPVPWWVGGVAFIGIELVVHLILRLRRRPNAYDGRG